MYASHHNHYNDYEPSRVHVYVALYRLVGLYTAVFLSEYCCIRFDNKNLLFKKGIEKSSVLE